MKTNLKKVLYLFSIIATLLALSALSAFAVDYSENAVLTGDCGEGSDVYWAIVPNEDGTEDNPKYSMYIYGTGTTFKNLKEDGTNVGYSTYDQTRWADYLTTLTRVYIGDNITTLGSGSFMRNTAIHTVELGANVAVLSMAAFEGCTNLKTIYRKGNTPVEGTFDLNGITSLGGYLFDGCQKVDTIILPTSGSYKLGTEFLKNNYTLQTIYIPKACYSIDTIAFRDCSALRAVYIEGDTIINEGEITKNSTTTTDGVTTETNTTYNGYAFNNCGVANSEGVRSFAISAVKGSPAYDYAMKNAQHSITTTTTKTTTTDEGTGEPVTTSSTTNYTIDYIEPNEVSVVMDGNEILKQPVVSGFGIDYELVIDNASYIIFSDETCSSIMSDAISENRTVYAKKIFDFLGYMVRIAEYHGLRAIYEYDTEAFANLENYSVVEVGVLGAKLYGIDPVLDLNYAEAVKTPIYRGNTLVGKLLSIPTGSTVSFANVAVDFKNDKGELSATRVSSVLLSRAYVTLVDETTGETYTYYSVQSEKDLTDACKKTKAAGKGILDDDAIAFLDDLIALGADPDYIYTKDEAMKHLWAVYEDPYHILSGQHIGYSKYTVRNALNNIYNATGEMPAVLSYDVAVASRSSSYGEESNTVIADDFVEFAKQGGLVSMCAHLKNPDPNATLLSDVYRGKLDTLDKWDLLFTDDGNDIHNNFMTELEAIGDFLQMMKDRGIPVFWRPLHEINGDWFWFCGGSVPNAGASKDFSVEYANKLWIYIYDYLVNERGLDNLIWVYSPNIAVDGSNSSAYDVMKYYPGDKYVDVMGIDWYTDRDVSTGKTPELLDDSAYATTWARLAGTYTGTKYDAVTKKMPVVYGEFGPNGSLRNPDVTLSYSGEDALELVEMVADTGRNMGWIVFWSSWTDSWMSLDTMYKADVFMQSDTVLDLSEARTLMLNIHYGE